MLNIITLNRCLNFSNRVKRSRGIPIKSSLRAWTISSSETAFPIFWRMRLKKSLGDIFPSSKSMSVPRWTDRPSISSAFSSPNAVKASTQRCRSRFIITPPKSNNKFRIPAKDVFISTVLSAAKIGRTEGKINLLDYIWALPILAFYAKVVNFVRYSGCIEKFLEAVLNLFRDRLSPMLKQIGVRDMQSIAGY